jgi:hypothetical protein
VYGRPVHEPVTMSADNGDLYPVPKVAALLRVRVNWTAVYGRAVCGIHVDSADRLTNAEGADKPSYLKLVARTHRILEARVRDNRDPRVSGNHWAGAKCSRGNDAKRGSSQEGCHTPNETQDQRPLARARVAAG